MSVTKDSTTYYTEVLEYAVETSGRQEYRRMATLTFQLPNSCGCSEETSVISLGNRISSLIRELNLDLPNFRVELEFLGKDDREALTPLELQISGLIYTNPQ
jgi:hypothetical protein